MPDEKKPTLSDVVKPITDEVAPATKTESTVPEVYQGKSLEDIIAIAEQNATNHAEAQKVIGRQGTELGEVRRLADQLINADLTKRTTGDDTSTDEIVNLDSFDDPKAATDAISKLIDRKVAERVSGMEQRVESLTGLSVEQRLNTDHPTWRSVVQSKEYLDWVNASPVRVRLAQEGNAGNYESGSELLSTFTALNPTKTATDDGDGDPATGSSKEDALKAAELEGGASKRKGGKKGPVYKRADIMELRIQDPNRYDSMRPEIRQAFAEGRVK